MNRDLKDINLIYSQTHKDFKGIVDGKKSVMYFDNGTTYGAIETLPDAIYEQKLKDAKKTKARKDNDKAIKEFYKFYITLDDAELSKRLTLCRQQQVLAFNKKDEKATQNLNNMENALMKARSYHFDNEYMKQLAEERALNNGNS